MKITDFEAQLAINGFADVDGTRVVSHGVQNVTEAEARAYIAHAKELYPHETITVLKKRPRLKGYAPASRKNPQFLLASKGASEKKSVRTKRRPPWLDLRGGLCRHFDDFFVKTRMVLTTSPSS